MLSHRPRSFRPTPTSLDASKKKLWLDTPFFCCPQRKGVTRFPSVTSSIDKTASSYQTRAILLAASCIVNIRSNTKAPLKKVILESKWHIKRAEKNSILRFGSITTHVHFLDFNVQVCAYLTYRSYSTPATIPYL